MTVAGEKRPFGHAVRIVRAVRVAARSPLDPTYREETIQIRRRGTRRTCERAAHLVRGFIRLEGEIEPYTKDEWLRSFGNGSETGRYRITDR